MEEFILKFIGGFDIQTILSLALIGWIFTRRIEKKFEERFNRLEMKVEDIDRRLCRLEGAFSSKECCILYHEHAKKAE